MLNRAQDVALTSYLSGIETAVFIAKPPFDFDLHLTLVELKLQGDGAPLAGDGSFLTSYLSGIETGSFEPNKVPLEVILTSYLSGIETMLITMSSVPN